MTLLKKYNARSVSELFDKCSFDEWQEVSALPSYHELLKTALELYIKLNLDLQRENMWQFAMKLALQQCPIVAQQVEFKKIFDLNNVNIHEFAKCVYNILNKVESKVNCLRLIGSANSGKTLIANCICLPFITCYNNNHGSENEFYLSNMLNKSLILCEELYITIATAEDMKSVLGGQPLDIAKKFNEKQLLSRTPVIMTSNHERFGRGHLAPVDENALALRCYTFYFNHVVKPELKLDSYQFYLFLSNYLNV